MEKTLKNKHEKHSAKKEKPLKILMALMGMDIGGAETHVLELCKALKKRGVDVYIISNGGAYEEELVKSGVKHYLAPMHNKNIINMVRSYFFLRRIIKENSIKLVHAHARIPAFLCGLLQKRLHFRFITTVHGIYNTSFFYRILTHWGEKSFAVSDDLKRYLMDNYKIASENIYMTINGIDTTKFSRREPNTKLLKELEININNRVILNVSRMDNDMTMPTYALINNASKLYESDNNIRIIIVGKGNDLENVVLTAEKANREIGERVIIVTGGRTDVNRFLSLAELFVGVSRSAIEALSSECPVVLAGNQGYIGIFNSETLSNSVDTNFCCRGFQNVTNKLVFEDVTKILNLTINEKKELGTYGRQIVMENYSVDRMADDALSLYSKMRKPNKKNDIVISGYYGTNNHGDDALLKAITDDLRRKKPDCSITVISNRPQETKLNYPVDAIYRFDFIKILLLMRRTNLLIFGGGTLVQDLTSSKSLFYYMGIISIAVKQGAEVMLYANGIGPLLHKYNKKLAKKTLQKVNLITLRDESSVNALKELGVTKPRVVLAADPVFSIRNTNALQDGESQLQIHNQLKGKKFFCIGIRSWKYSKVNFEEDISELCNYVMEKYGLEALFVPMQHSFDYEISKRIMVNLKKPCHILDGDFKANELLNIMQNAEFLIGMRLHAIVYAAKVGTPVMGLVYDPKVRGMMETFKQEYCVDVSDFDVNTLKQYADSIINNKEEISSQLLEIVAKLEEKARISADYAFEILNRNEF